MELILNQIRYSDFSKKGKTTLTGKFDATKGDIGDVQEIDRTLGREVANNYLDSLGEKNTTGGAIPVVQTSLGSKPLTNLQLAAGIPNDSTYLNSLPEGTSYTGTTIPVESKKKVQTLNPIDVIAGINKSNTYLDNLGNM